MWAHIISLWYESDSEEFQADDEGIAEMETGIASDVDMIVPSCVFFHTSQWSNIQPCYILSPINPPIFALDNMQVFW